MTIVYREKSDKQLKREAKKAEKQSKKQAHKLTDGKTSDLAEEAAGDAVVNGAEDLSAGNYGLQEMNQSKEKPSHSFIDVGILSGKLKDQNVWVRAR